MLKINFVSPKNSLINSVISLADKNNKTLGHFPKNAFIEKAREKCILIATINNQLAGYLMFRTVQSRRSLSITHLCVDSIFRNQQVAIKLLDELKLLFKPKVRTFELNCLEEYTRACNLWKNYGFIPLRDKKSRNKKKDKNLIYWVLDFNKPNLFTDIQNQTLNNHKLSAMLDLNILIKEREQDEEVKYIYADWLKNEVDFYTTKETYSEILRDKDRERKELTRKIKNKYHESKIPIQDIKNIASQLHTHIIKGTSENDESDRMQVAESIAMNADYFITTDQGILKKSELILEHYNLNVLSPTSFVQEIDQYVNTDNYFPFRLGGANYEVKQISPNELNNVSSKFNSPIHKEKKKDFEDKLNKIIIKKPHGIVSIIKNPSKEIIAVFGSLFEKKTSSLDVIRMDSHSSLNNVLFKQIIFQFLQDSLAKGITTIKIKEKFLDKKQENILEEFNFQKKGNYWVKLGVFKLIKSKDLDVYLPEVKEVMEPESFQNLKNGIIKDSASLYQIERTFFPVKFIDLDIPTYIIPIKPYWASQLFDNYMASKTLFGADPLLVWNRENIYYRNEKPVTEEVPARILWYASSDRNYPRSKAIVGCSYIDNVIVGKAKELYKRFKRFGIYKWQEIITLAKDDADKNIKALKFSDTEVFKKPISLKKVQEILGNKQTFQGPVLIKRETFNQLYNLANTTKKEIKK